MPEPTIDITDLPKSHPALKKDGTLKKKALKALAQREIPSRIGSIDGILDYENDPIRNTKLFKIIAREIEMFPDSYDQSTWAEESSGVTICGTAFCIAGHAAHFTGWKPGLYEDWREMYHWDTVIKPSLGLELNDEDAPAIDDVAGLELGLTLLESYFLFAGNWTPKDGMTVPEALRAIGKGERITEVSNPDHHSWAPSREMLIEQENSRKIRASG